MLPPKGVHLPISKLHWIFAVANLLAHNNISKICYCCQISLQSAAVNCYFLLSNTFGSIFYFAGDENYNRALSMEKIFFAIIDSYCTALLFYPKFHS